MDVDFKGYFDSIPHDKLMERVRELISDGKLLALLEKYLKAGVFDTLKGWEPTEQGTPQGAVISPLLANLYLNPLDHLMAKQGYDMSRYADDFVVQCRSEAEAKAALEMIRQWAQENGSTAIGTSFQTSMAGCEGVCVASCASIRGKEVLGEAVTISVGQMTTSTSLGCSV